MFYIAVSYTHLARKLAANMNKGYEIDARVPSILIAGGSNFPIRKKEKQNAALDSNYREWQDIQGILDKIRSTCLLYTSEEEYEYRILNVKLTNKPIASLAEELVNPQQFEMFKVYLQIASPQTILNGPQTTLERLIHTPAVILQKIVSVISVSYTHLSNAGSRLIFPNQCVQ